MRAEMLEITGLELVWFESMCIVSIAFLVVLNMLFGWKS